MQSTTLKRTMLVPQYMRTFTCIGSECEDSCCVGWQVSIDEKTFKKYKRVRNQDLSPLFQKNITRVRSSSNPNNFGKISMNKNECCPFLSEEKLCNIQLKLGEGYLSETCNSYPRILNQVNGIFERSATLSCPEAARLALLNLDGIQFDEVEEEVGINTVIAKSLKSKHMEGIEKYFWELRIFTIQILQNRTYTLGDRLIILGMFYQRVEEIVQSQQLDLIPHHIASYMNVIQDGSLRVNLANIPVRYEIQMKLAKQLADARYNKGISNHRFMECYIEMMQGLQYSSDVITDDTIKYYMDAFNEYYQPFMNEHDYILENYLVNYVYKNLFPFGGFQSVFDDYVMMIVHYAMIKLHLIGMASFHKQLTTQLVIKLIQSFAKTIEHNSLFLRGVFNLLKDNGYTTMAYMSILIKN
ncbi:flagellin lysine-N-methylase [Neobacillus ginsengisoli]|uniref:Lysine-N-methylase n=1 Tax=Neobacillus ginsengisoli TaxID=904295 RepID=A0ABT9XVG9_9BACI|nr:flagellin lysine-N-methylase [Neobacillus ginsengisoli]MDQ0199570.1 lysine-N-methylase [Neobacillus ginsengisoli]